MIPLFLAAFQVAKGIEEGRLAKGQAKIDKVTMKSNTLVRNMQRQVDTTLAKAHGDLNRFKQSKSNQNKIKAGAANVEAQTTNLLRMTDEAVRGGLDRRIAAAEEAGALAAASGGAGIGGGSVGMLAISNQIRQQRVEELTNRQLDTAAYDTNRNIAQTIDATVLGLDDIQFNDNFDYTTSKESYIKEPSWTEIGMNAAMTFADTYSKMGGFDNLGKQLDQTSLGKTVNGWFGRGTGRTTTQLK